MHTPQPAPDRALARAEAVRAMARRFTDLAGRAPDQSREVTATPGWSINDTLGHVAMEPSRYDALARGGGEWPAQVAGLPAFNADQIRTLPTRDPHELADKLRADTDALLDTIGSFGDQPPMMNFDGDQRVRADRALGTLLGEFVVHGRDIARTLGVHWHIDATLVPLILDGLHQVMPGWLNPERAVGHTATYRLRLRRLSVTHTYRILQGQLSIDLADSMRADVHINAEPVTWLLLSYGRINQWAPVLNGRVLVWGRKPWLAAGFSKLFHAA